MFGITISAEHTRRLVLTAQSFTLLRTAGIVSIARSACSGSIILAQDITLGLSEIAFRDNSGSLQWCS
jgi:hypothetical protein